MPHGIIRHTHTYDQIKQRNSLGRDICAKPEPQKPRKYLIFNHEVDRATYEKYNHNEYSFGGVFHNLLAVEVWATSRELAEEYPEAAAEAREIKEQINEEITGKEAKKMREVNTAVDFLGALNDIYAESRAAHAEMYDKLESARERMNEAQAAMRDPGKDRRVEEARYLVAKADFREMEDIIRIEHGKMMGAHDLKVNELRERLLEHLGDYYASSPDRLDANTMQLLNSGICTPSDLARLIDRHEGNPTMQRIVGEYARNLRKNNRQKMSNDDQVICSNVANAGDRVKDGSRELSIFDSAVSAMERGLQKDRTIADRMDKHIAGWMETFHNQMAELSGRAG